MDEKKYLEDKSTDPANSSSVNEDWEIEKDDEPSNPYMHLDDYVIEAEEPEEEYIYRTRAFLSARQKIYVAAALAVVLIIGLIVGMLTGVLATKKNRILISARNTFDFPVLEDEIKSLSGIMEDGKYSAFSDVKINDLNINGNPIQGASLYSKMVSDTESNKLAYYLNGSYAGLNASLSLRYDATTLSGSTSLLPNMIYSYNYSTPNKTGYLVSLAGTEKIQAFDTLIKEYSEYSTTDKKEEYNEKLKELSKEGWKKVKVKRIKSKECISNGKKRKCSGYSVTITKAELEGVLSDMSDLYDEYYGEMSSAYAQIQSTSNSAVNGDSMNMYKSLFKNIVANTSITQLDLQVYLHFNNLVEIDFVYGGSNCEIQFKGGDYGLQNVSIVAKNSYIVDSIDKTSSISGTVIDTKLSTVSGNVASPIMHFTYDTDNGNYTLDLSLGTSNVSASGNVQYGSEEFKVTVEKLAISDVVKSDINITSVISNNIEIGALEGTTVDVCTLTPADVEKINNDFDLNYQNLIAPFIVQPQVAPTDTENADGIVNPETEEGTEYKRQPQRRTTALARENAGETTDIS